MKLECMAGAAALKVPAAGGGTTTERATVSCRHCGRQDAGETDPAGLLGSYMLNPLLLTDQFVQTVGKPAAW